MEKLSSELLTEIISHLPSSYQVECIRVCKRWFQTITDSILYSDLSLVGSSLHQAVTYFQDTPYITGSNVRRLMVSQSTFENIAVTFPRVECLDWRMYMLYSSKPSRPTQIYEPWSKSLRYLHEHTGSFLARVLLRNHICYNLKELHVSFIYLAQYQQGMFQEFVGNIHRAPHIQSLTLEHAPISLSDLNQITSTLSQTLEKLDIQHPKRQLSDRTHVPSRTPAIANKLKTFNYKLSGSTSNEFSTEEVRMIKNHWIRYIGHHYKTLSILVIDYCRYTQNAVRRRVDAQFDEKSLLYTLGELKSLKVYQTNICNMSQNVVGRLESNDVKLHGVSVWINNNDQMVQDFDCMRASMATCDIEDLQVQCYDVEIIDINRLYNQISHNIYVHQLTHLTLVLEKPDSQQNLAAFFLDILLTMSNLKTLNMNSIYLNKENFTSTEWLDTRRNRAMETARCQLRELKLVICDEDSLDLEQLNLLERFFDLILSYCKRTLRSLDLSGRINVINGYGICKLTLSMASIIYLKQITLTIWGFGAYQFENIPRRRGKYYTDYHRSCTAPEVEEAWKRYHVGYSKLILNIELNEQQVETVNLKSLVDP